GRPAGDRLQRRLPARGARVGPVRRDRPEADQPAPARADHRRGRGLLVPDHAHSARRLIVRELQLREFRSYERLELALQPGVVLAVGPNGVGKTNLLESLHVGTQGFSPRTRLDARLVRHGAERARVRVGGEHTGRPTEVEVRLATREAKEVWLNGALLRSADLLRAELTTLVFTPDRLAVVKGGPAVRRAYLDRVLARLLPARATLPGDYAAALAQRNAALRAVAAGRSPAAALDPWTAQVATLGEALVEARRETVRLLDARFSLAADELGLAAARLAYAAEPPTVQLLDARLARDLERGSTGIGPHLDDPALSAGDRDLRAFGSQGEQRLAVLAL